MRFFRHRMAVRQPRRAVPDRPRRDLREARSRRTASTSSTSTTSPPAPDAEGQAPLRHRPARPRLPQPGHLRHPDVALGRALRRLPLDGDRDDGRLARRLLRRPHRQPADALHRPHPDAPGPRRAAHRCGVLRHTATRSRSALILALPALDGLAPHRARRLPVAAREGVRRGREGGGPATAHHPAAHPPERARADHRLHDADRRRRDPHRGGALASSASGSSRRTPRSAS